MLNYARDDTHYLLYIYDKMRLELWERGNGQPSQLQVVWQRSRDICLKVIPRPTRKSGSLLVPDEVPVLPIAPHVCVESQMF